MATAVENLELPSVLCSLEVNGLELGSDFYILHNFNLELFCDCLQQWQVFALLNIGVIVSR